MLKNKVTGTYLSCQFSCGIIDFDYQYISEFIGVILVVIIHRVEECLLKRLVFLVIESISRVGIMKKSYFEVKL